MQDDFSEEARTARREAIGESLKPHPLAGAVACLEEQLRQIVRKATEEPDAFRYFFASVLPDLSRRKAVLAAALADYQLLHPEAAACAAARRSVARK